jgi:hypothetical protein
MVLELLLLSWQAIGLKIIFGGECHHFKKVFAFPAPDVVYCYLWAEQGGGNDNSFGGDSSTNSIEAG